MVKVWAKLKGSEKTREQEIELFLKESRRNREADEPKPKKEEWKSLSGAEKTKKQMIELLEMEQKREEDKKKQNKEIEIISSETGKVNSLEPRNEEGKTKEVKLVKDQEGYKLFILIKNEIERKRRAEEFRRGNETTLMEKRKAENEILSCEEKKKGFVGKVIDKKINTYISAIEDKKTNTSDLEKRARECDLIHEIVLDAWTKGYEIKVEEKTKYYS